MVHSNIFIENALHAQFSTHFLNCKHADNESISHSFTEEIKPSKKIHQIRSNWDRAAEEKMRSRGEGEIEGEIGAIVRWAARSTRGAIDERRDRQWSLFFLSLSPIWALSFLSLSLSLSLFPEMIWTENKSVKLIPGQRSKSWSTGNEFPENKIFRCSQTCRLGWKWFPEIIFTQNKRSLGFVSPFFCPFVENWPLLSTLLLYVYLIIVLLFYYYLGLSWLYLVFFFFF